MKKYEPYAGDPIKLQLSFVCFADILGYSCLSKKAISSGHGEAFLVNIREALTQAYTEVRERAKSWNESHQFFSVKVFTDNIVVGYPIRNFADGFGESELGHLFTIFSEYQMNLAIKGFLVRGGIAFGQHYMDQDIVFGDALIDAVKQDVSGGAPRMSLSPSAVEALQHHLRFYSEPEHSPQSYHLLQDADGSVFINYLNNAFVAFPDGPIFYEIFEKHKDVLESGLSTYKSNPDVKAKFDWVARYHNYVIDDFFESNPMPAGPDGDEVYASAVYEAQKLKKYRIDIDLFSSRPSKLRLIPMRHRV
ncbi:MAG: hypothetical protein RKH07_03420 [Gammaproteobacteria bacterium]